MEDLGPLELRGTWGGLGGKDLLHTCRENPCPRVIGLLEVSSEEGGMVWIRRKWQGKCGFASQGDRDVWEKHCPGGRGGSADRFGAVGEHTRGWNDGWVGAAGASQDPGAPGTVAQGPLLELV